MCKRHAFTALIVFTGLIVAGLRCGRAGESAEPSTLAMNRMADMQMAAESAPAKAFAEPPQTPSPGAPGSGLGPLAGLASTQPDRYLIKNAIITVETEDSRVATTKLVASLEPAGAYVSNLNEHVDGLGRRTVTLQVRVPADKFDASMSQLESLGKVLSKQVSTEDVTEEFVDTESRSRNLKKTEERLLDHLNRAAQLEDILRVEQELTRVREDIERMDGRLRYLGNRVSFSTISVTIQEAAKAEPIMPAQSFSTAKEFSEAIRSLVVFLQGLWSQAIWLIVWLPVYAAPVVLGWYIYRRIRRRALNL